MGRQIGSQIRETVEEAGYEFIVMADRDTIILADENGRQELWTANDHHAGYTVEWKGVGYEFNYALKEKHYHSRRMF